MTAYYNENDPRAAEWLRNLILFGEIAYGEVDTRSIEDVTPNDLKGFTQCHFFAGIGGWSYALRFAGWPDARPVWTGSCPCQPFSAAGKGGGYADERHLWPAFFHLIGECRPATIFGEQVASKDGLNWLDLVSTDLEGAGYAFGAADLCAAGVGAPHIRQRLWFVAHHHHHRREARERHGKAVGYRDAVAADGRQSIVGNNNNKGLEGRHERRDSGDELLAGAASLDDALEHDARLGRLERRPESSERSVAGGRGESELADTEHTKRGPLHINGQNGRDRPNIGRQKTHGKSGACGEVCELGDAGQPRTRRDVADTDGGNTSAEREQRSGKHGLEPQNGSVGEQAPQTSAWSPCDFIPCTDGKARPVEPGTFPLAYGVPGRVGLLRGYGNAIVPQVAAAFIEACNV